MKALFKTAAIAALSVGLAAPAFGQTATGNAMTSIVAPITIAPVDTLTFGHVVKPREGTGTVAINAATGAQTLGTGILSVSGSTPKRGTLTVEGDPNRSFAATIPPTMILSNGTAAQDITVALTSTVSNGTATLSAAGTATIGMGGSSNLSSTQAAGTYNGTYSVTVAYN